MRWLALAAQSGWVTPRRTKLLWRARYVRTNYKHLEYVEETPACATMATFRKLREDDRSWDFHVNF